MGNKYLIYDSECDNCNLKLSVYENDLANFIGMMRTADRIKGQSGIPKYKSADKNLEMYVETNDKGSQIVSIIDRRPKIPTEDERSIILNAIKPSYKPLHVMKSFYKIAYSLLKPSELSEYTSLLKIIISKEYDSKLKDFAKVLKFTLPVILKTPSIITYKKKEEFKDENIPTKVVVIHFGRYMYQFFLINTEDKFLFKEGEKCTWIATPPYWGSKMGKTYGERIDLSSTELRKGELDSIIFHFDNPL